MMKFYLLQYCTVGRISHECGWKYQDVITTLEDKRKIKASVAYGRKKQLKVGHLSLHIYLFSLWWSLTPFNELDDYSNHALPTDAFEKFLLDPWHTSF